MDSRSIKIVPKISNNYVSSIEEVSNTSDAAGSCNMLVWLALNPNIKTTLRKQGVLYLNKFLNPLE